MSFWSKNKREILIASGASLLAGGSVGMGLYFTGTTVLPAITTSVLSVSAAVVTATGFGVIALAVIGLLVGAAMMLRKNYKHARLSNDLKDKKSDKAPVESRPPGAQVSEFTPGPSVASGGPGLFGGSGTNAGKTRYIPLGDVITENEVQDIISRLKSELTLDVSAVLTRVKERANAPIIKQSCDSVVKKMDELINNNDMEEESKMQEVVKDYPEWLRELKITPFSDGGRLESASYDGQTKSGFSYSAECKGDDLTILFEPKDTNKCDRMKPINNYFQRDAFADAFSSRSQLQMPVQMPELFSGGPGNA